MASNAYFKLIKPRHNKLEHWLRTDCWRSVGYTTHTKIDATRLSAQHQALVSDQVVKWLSFVKAHIWKFALKNQTVHMFKTSTVDRTLLPHFQICYT